jgi:mRNA interferase MazF
MKRGEIWTVSGGPDYASKPRPAIIIQDDSFGDTSSATFCPMTSKGIDTPFFRIEIVPDGENGLLLPSFAMVDKVTTVKRDKFGSFVGTLSAFDMAAVDQALLTFLGLIG